MNRVLNQVNLCLQEGERAGNDGCKLWDLERVGIEVERRIEGLERG